MWQEPAVLRPGMGNIAGCRNKIKRVAAAEQLRQRNEAGMRKMRASAVLSACTATGLILATGSQMLSEPESPISLWEPNERGEVRADDILVLDADGNFHFSSADR